MKAIYIDHQYTEIDIKVVQYCLKTINVSHCNLKKNSKINYNLELVSLSSIVAILFFNMVYSINRTQRGSEVNVIRGLFPVAFDFVVSADDSDDEDDSDDDGGAEDDEDEDLYGHDEALQQ